MQPTFLASLSALILTLTASTAQAKDRLVKVLKSDGQYSIVRLLPVHLDPTHVEIVKKRAAESRALYERLEVKLPASHVIPNDAFTPVRDQKDRGLCAYFAVMGIVESFYVKEESPRSLNLSEHCLAGLRNWMFDTKFNYAEAPTVRPDPDGDEPHSIALTIARFGVPTESRFGELNCRYDDHSEAAINLNQYFRVFSQGGSRAYGRGVKFDIDKKPTLERVMALLAKDISVEVSILVFDSFFETPNWRYTRAKVEGGHSIVLTGYKKDERGNIIFRFRNSWGATWGYHGYGSIDEKTLLHSWAKSPDFDMIISLHRQKIGH